jgi:hypothetical protein
MYMIVGDSITVQPYNHSRLGSSAMELLLRPGGNWTFAQITPLNASAVVVPLPAGTSASDVSGVRCECDTPYLHLVPKILMHSVASLADLWSFNVVQMPGEITHVALPSTHSLRPGRCTARRWDAHYLPRKQKSQQCHFRSKWLMACAWLCPPEC